MARIPKPWFRSARNAYFVHIEGRLYNLGPNKEEAYRAYHRLMAEPKAQTKRKDESLAICEVLDLYLEWCQQNRAVRTYDWYRDHFKSFLAHLGKERAASPVGSLKPYHVTEWTASHPTWKENYRRGAIIAIQRGFNWALKQGRIDLNPIRSVEKPQPKRREVFISVEEWQQIRDHYPEGDAFRDLLIFLWETGARPFEARTMERRHLSLTEKLAVFPKEEAKGKRRARVILLTDRVAEIIERRLKTVKVGPVFTNEDGKPWTAYAINCRFKRLQKTLGVKHFAYALRHGFCQRKLVQGIDHLTVASLMGHVNGVMVSQVYSHLGKATAHLRAALTKDEGVSG